LEAYRGKTIVTYCAVGVRAMRALEALQQAGYPKLGHLAGDIPAWSQAGLPLE
jgi:rhodanese-related sulfurtransferase